MYYYQLSGKMETRSLPALLGFGLLGALITGVVVGFVTQWIDLIILFAILVGVGTGVGVMFGVKAGHCRNKNLIMVLSLIFGLIAYGTKNYMNYRTARTAVGTQIQEMLAKDPKAGPQLKNLSASEFYDLYLEKETGKKGFAGWFEMTLQRGVSISHHGRDGINLGYTGSMIYFVIEFLLAAGAAYFMAISQLKTPYCETCSLWTKPGLVYVTTSEFAGQFHKTIDPLTTKDRPPSLLAQVPGADPKAQHAKLIFHCCPRCKATYVTGTIFTPSGDKGQFSETSVFENMGMSGKFAEALRRPQGEQAEEA